MRFNQIKFSDERNKKYSIRTSIYEENGIKKVRKEAIWPEGTQHIRDMLRFHDLLNRYYPSMKACPIRPAGNAVEFDFISGTSLEDRYRDAVAKEDRKKFEELLKEHAKIACGGEENRCTFHVSKEFERDFGNAAPYEGQKGLVLSNYDAIAGNVIFTEDEGTFFIDYEWVLEYPMPAELVIFHCIRDLYYHIEGLEEFYPLADALKLLDIQTDETILQESYLKYWHSIIRDGESYGYADRKAVALKNVRSRKKVLDDLDDFSRHFYEAQKRLDILDKNFLGNVEIYIDHGEGYPEKPDESVRLNDAGDMHAEFAIDDTVKSVRVIPGHGPCIVRNHEVSTEMGTQFLDELKSNGWAVGHDILLFSNENPYFEISKWKAGATKMTVSIRRFALDQAASGWLADDLKREQDRVVALSASRARLESLAEQRDNITEAFMLSKSVRAYRKALRSLHKPDPWQELYPVMPNDDAHITIHIDSISYRKESYLIKGWSVDHDFDHDTITVVNQQMQVIPARIYRGVRKDVADAMQMDENGTYGFAVHLKYADVNEQPLYLHVVNGRGVCNVQLEIEYDPEKRAAKAIADTDLCYDNWYHMHRPDAKELQRQREETFDRNIKFSIVIPLYKTPEKFLRELVRSFQAQTYPNWELVLSDGSGDPSPIDGILREIEQQEKRVKVVRNHRQLYISDNTNAAIEAATGDYICFCDHDDLVTPDALYQNAEVLKYHPDVDVLYSDEDKITDDGIYIEPHFKPDFNESLLCAQNYICHFFVVRREILDKAGLLNGEYDGSQDHDFILRCTEQTKNIWHIRKILYHWRLSMESTAQNPYSKMYAYESGRRAVAAHYERLHIPAKVEKEKFLGHFRTYYFWKETPKVSVLIPNKDHSDVLDRCITSLEKQKYKNFDVIIIENNSTEEATFAYYKTLSKRLDGRIKVVTYKGDFNYSAINNFGETYADGEYLLLLNNDTEMIYDTCMQELLYPCMRDDVGAVGARLYFPNDTIQHAGVVIGFGGVAGHKFVGLSRKDHGYMYRAVVTQDVSAVTAACMMVKKRVFDEVGGFYEGLAVAYNDVDLCLRIGKDGYRIVYNPYAELYHYESASRGHDTEDPKKMERLQKEADIFSERWKDILTKGDPLYNPNFTRKPKIYSLKEMDEYGK